MAFHGGVAGQCDQDGCRNVRFLQCAQVVQSRSRFRMKSRGIQPQFRGGHRPDSAWQNSVNPYGSTPTTHPMLLRTTDRGSLPQIMSAILNVCRKHHRRCRDTSISSEASYAPLVNLRSIRSRDGRSRLGACHRKQSMDEDRSLDMSMFRGGAGKREPRASTPRGGRHRRPSGAIPIGGGTRR